MLKFVSVLKLLRGPDKIFISRMSSATTASEVASVQTQGIKRPYDEVSELTDGPPHEPELKKVKRRKFAILISYSGLGYFGLQRNPGTKTIEDEILNVFHKTGLITDEGLSQPQSFQFQRAARTDKGVSAIRQVLSARLPEEFDLKEVNSLLPDQIRVMGVKRVTKGFNCKMNCNARTYSYTMPSFSLACLETFLSLVPPSEADVANSEVPPAVSSTGSEPLGAVESASTEEVSSTAQVNFTTDRPHEQVTSTVPEINHSSKKTSSESSEVSSTGPEVSIASEGHTSEAESGPQEDYSKVYAFRASPELIVRTNQVLQKFLGTHNFHNFTSRRKPLDPSCQRYIISFSCSDPILYGDMEFVTIRVKGQSFMLHQIRKMVGLVVAIVRGLTTEESISKAWEKDRLDLPIAPGLGLVLEEVHYDRYNKRYGQDGVHDPIDWSHLSKELDEFKNKFILSTILKTEKAEHSMCLWLKGLSQHSFDVRESGPPEKRDDKNSENGYDSD